jgi:hypothetical protein
VVIGPAVHGGVVSDRYHRDVVVHGERASDLSVFESVDVAVK